MDVTLLGISILIRPLQPSNAEKPIEVTLSGISMLVSDEGARLLPPKIKQKQFTMVRTSAFAESVRVESENDTIQNYIRYILKYVHKTVGASPRPTANSAIAA